MTTTDPTCPHGCKGTLQQEPDFWICMVCGDEWDPTLWDEDTGDVLPDTWLAHALNRVAESEQLIAEPGDLIEYHAGDAARTPRDGLFVGHDDEGRVVVSDEDGNVDHVPPFRVHGVF